MIMHKLFDNYDGTLPVIDGFIEDSWRNDACPSMINEKRGLKLWVDYVNPDLRECSGKRYTLCEYDDNTENYVCNELLATDSLSDLMEFLK